MDQGTSTNETEKPKIRPHQKQIDAFYDESRFKFILAGRRGGKTYLITEDIVKTVHSAPNYAEILYVGPSLIQARELIWEPLEERMFRLGWKFEPKISKSRFELSRKRKIYILGAEKISRIRGHKFFKAYLDELAFFEKDFRHIWNAVRPTLSDYKGGAILSTTPNGKGTQAYDVYMAALQKHDWSTHIWRTIDNPYIDPQEIEEAKQDLDEKSFKQEYEATWESYDGLAYYNFDENFHIKNCSDINPDKPIIITLDFNCNPTTLLVCQTIGNLIVVKKEYSESNSSTEATVQHFCDEYRELAGRIKIFIRGDAAGRARSSNTGRSDYEYVHEALRINRFDFEHQVPAKNPAIIDRVKWVNGWLKPMKGEPRILIDPSCKDLIRDLTSQGLDGRVPSKKNNLGHKADALGYNIYWEHVVGSRPPQKTIEL